MVLRTSLMMAALCSVGFSPLYAFDVPDDAQTQMNRVVFGTVLDDLLVGDKMRISNTNFCVSGGKLMLPGATPAQEVSEYRAVFTAEIAPGGGVKVNVITAYMREATKEDVAVFLFDCDIFGGSKMYPVESINGATSLEEYLKSGSVTGLPIERP